MSAWCASRCSRRWGTTTGADKKRHFSDPRHTSIRRATKQTVKAALVEQQGRIKPVFVLVFGEEQLCDSHWLNQMHGSMAVRALPQRRLCEERCFLRRGLVEQSAAEGQHAGSSAVGEEA